MALVSMRQLLDHAAENDYGVPAFNINNMEQMLAIMAAAETCDAPVILRAEAGVMGKLLACQGAWCQMELNEMRAWLPRADIFGALPNEQFQ